MKRVMCGKMTMAYQNVQLGKGPSNVVYRVRGPKAGQQGSEGSPRAASCIVPGTTTTETDSTAAWNILALSMLIRSQSPDSSNSSFAAPLPPSSNSASIPSSLETSLSCVADGKISSSISCCSSASSSSSSLYSGQSSQGEGVQVADFESRSADGILFTDGSNVASGAFVKRVDSAHLSSQPSSEYCSTDSGSDGERDRGIESTRAIRGDTAHQEYRNFALLEYSHANIISSVPTGGLELSSSSSSIGACDGSSLSSGDGSTLGHLGDMEVDSKPNGGLQNLRLLEDSLPMKRGLSKFYNGRAKSFSSFADLSSVEELAKPDDYYARRRRTSVSSNRRKADLPKCRLSTTSGISKRSATSSGKTGLAVAMAMSSQLQESSAEEDQRSHSPVAASAFPPSLRTKSLKSLADAGQLAFKHA